MDPAGRGRRGGAGARPRVRLAVAAISVASAVLIVFGITQLRTLTSPPTGLAVFDRAPTSADRLEAPDGELGRVDAATRLLGDVLGWSWFGTRTADGEVCLARSAPEQAVPFAIRCTSEDVFAAEGLTDWLRLDDVPLAERVEGVTYREAFEVRWPPDAGIAWEIVPASEAQRDIRIGVGVIPLP
ncbi:hypothetical protein ARHIZOSPH14_10530 [Agromyces rhizosphaerae]|uniref:Uncharacterized protein n=1 Tax=Agromyces rhizosphaerae TaxID=88374 RepID=A0A9W6CVG8_9MICO|nr:hypothetical protein [Agromyces rhizosphaerae]GLI26811.1 hypothetical protein ARHIZOSPH14_10530 [Agromyces rhizosphaerae]